MCEKYKIPKILIDKIMGYLDLNLNSFVLIKSNVISVCRFSSNLKEIILNPDKVPFYRCKNY